MVQVPDAPVAVVTTRPSVLASALPSAVAEGKVRTAVVFEDGGAPVRWGVADDEARLAALYAVVPHLGSFTATTGADTYRVLRLPGIGVALVSEGAAAATWVEGWFAALLHATQFALRIQPPTTDLVAAPGVATGEDAVTPAQVLEQLEDECRRILATAQEQAREIREAAERDVARAEPPPATPREERPALRDEVDELLADAERARATLLADAAREAEQLRRVAAEERATLLAEAERRAVTMLEDATREAKVLRRDAKRLRREAARLRDGLHKRKVKRTRRDRGRSTSRRDDERTSSGTTDVLRAARRTADDLLHDAQRAADDLIRDAARTRQRLLDEVTRLPAPPVVAPVAAVGAPVPAPASTPDTVGVSASPEEARLAALALLGAAAESVTALSALLKAAADAGGTAASGDPLRDLPGLYYGA